MSIKTVLLIGAGGSLGAPVLSELRKSFTVTILTRSSSTSTFPADIKVITVPDSYPEEPLVAAFTGQDAVVSTITTTSSAQGSRFVDAALKAGVRRFIPAEFGSDAEDEATANMVPAIWGEKRRQMEYLREACKKSGGRMSWTAIANGGLFDWLFVVTKGGFGHIDFQNKKMLLFDEGETRFAMSNLAQVARAVRSALEREAETRDRALLVRSFGITQNQLREALEKVTGDKFEVERVDSKEYLAEWVPRSQGGEQKAMFNVLWATCVTDSDWTGRDHLANELLGLEEEDLEESLRAALAKM